MTLNTPIKKVPRIVVIGGGTGSYTSLSGLKHHRVHLTAIVSMADDGGSSGRLRDEFGHLPPGDVRRCLLALSSDSSPALRRLFQYRFSRGEGLGGHSFGNLLLTALTEITGRSDLAIAEAGRMLGIKGDVLPVTLTDSRLFAELEDGSILCGEKHIDVRAEGITGRIERIYLEPRATAFPPALAAIYKADAIVIGPGDLYTSVLPSFLVAGISSAIAKSVATRIYVCNVMTKRGETDGFAASDFVREVQRYLGVNKSLDDVILTDTFGLPRHLLDRYESERAFPVAADFDNVRMLGVRPHVRPIALANNLLRHDPDLLAEVIMELIDRDAALLEESRHGLNWRTPHDVAAQDGPVITPGPERWLKVAQ